jgi:hypothetical protein
MTVRRAITIATIGRLMKNLDTILQSFLALSYRQASGHSRLP